MPTPFASTAQESLHQPARIRARVGGADRKVHAVFVYAGTERPGPALHSQQEICDFGDDIRLDNCSQMADHKRSDRFELLQSCQQVLVVADREAWRTDARQRSNVCHRMQKIVYGAIGVHVLSSEILGFRSDCVDEGGRVSLVDLDTTREEILCQHRRRSAVLDANIHEGRLLAGSSHRMMVEDKVRHSSFWKLIVAGPWLGIHESEVAIVLPIDVTNMTQADAQSLDHLLILGPSDDASVGYGDSPLETLTQELAQRCGRCNRIRIGIVVSQDQPSTLRTPGLEVGIEFRQLLLGLLGDHGFLSSSRGLDSRGSCRHVRRATTIVYSQSGPFPQGCERRMRRLEVEFENVLFPLDIPDDHGSGGPGRLFPTCNGQ